MEHVCTYRMKMRLYEEIIRDFVNMLIAFPILYWYNCTKKR